MLYTSYTIYINLEVIIDSYRFIDWFSDIGFY